MKKITFVLMLVISALLASGVIAANENDVFLPLLYGGPAVAPPAETPTSTPEVVDPTPALATETPTTTPDNEDGYNWVFIGDAYNNEEGLTVIWGHKPGYCYDLTHNKVEKTIYLESVKIPIGECDRDGYNPAAEWPPPEFPPPPSLPPEFDYGHIYKLVLDINAKVVCSVYWPENCVNVR
jgi:hypothetical protein